MSRNKGRVTVPTDTDVIEGTLDVMDRWGADAIRDCDGTKMPEEFKSLDVKRYATYYTTRKDNDWARKNPEEIQQMYLMSKFYTASSTTLIIPIMKHYYQDQLMVNTVDDIKRWWEVIDRTNGTVVGTHDWSYDATKMEVTISNTIPFHAYTVSFLAFIVWDPVHMYNSLTNDWQGQEKQMTYDVRQPKTKAYAIEKFKKYLQENSETDVIRFTTFFHQFTLVFDEYARETFVDWFGYSASVSPYILERFEKQVGYPFRAEYIINQGYYNATSVVPSKEFRDFLNFQQQEVSALMKVFIDLTHDAGKEAMMFLGDHWIGSEPYGAYFQHLGLDAVVGSVGNGMTLRLISEIPGLKYSEGRFLPYFFPDTFYEGGDPVREAKINWVTARRAILRKPVDRIGYGGYLKLALQFPAFIDYVEKVTDEFRALYDKVGNNKPYVVPFKVYILNSWGKLRSWSTHMVAHALPYPQNRVYEGVLEALSGLPLDISFISFDDLLQDTNTFEETGVIINVGDAYTAFSGGAYWNNPKILEKIRKFVYEGNGFIGIGEPSAYQSEGKYFQLYDMLGVDKEIGFSLSKDKYNWDEKQHFIIEGLPSDLDFGDKVQFVYAQEDTTVIKQSNHSIHLASHTYGKGKAVYMSGLPFNFANTRLLYRSLYYAAGKQNEIKQWYADNYNVEVNAYPKTNSFCVVNNTYEEQSSIVYKGDGSSFEITLQESEIRWFEM
ncbi:MAG: 1,3-beta-galactosyl-N-acetylhexosamine phosphorylase [Breznakia sp.]